MTLIAGGTALGWLWENRQFLINAGIDVASLVKRTWDLFHAEGGTITKTDFNAFIDKALGDKAELVAIIDAAKAEL